MILGIAPVSGGAFPAQLAAYALLIKHGIRPSCIMASSGGNIASYIVSAADWKIDGIIRILGNLRSDDMFVPWTPIFNSIVGFFRGSLYRPGPGVHQILRENFTSMTIQDDEIWTGTYNRTRQQARFFGNRGRTNSIFGSSDIDSSLNYCMELTFLEGDVEKIATASQASASIPALIEPQEIDGEPYCDGGLSCASPLQGFESIILDKYQSFHLIYINGMNLKDPVNVFTCGGNVLVNGRLAASELVRSHLIADRLCAYHMLTSRSHIGHLKPNFEEIDIKDLSLVFESYEIIDRSLLEFYPNDYEEIDITDFDGADILAMFERCQKRIQCRFWWIGNASLMQDLRDRRERKIAEHYRIDLLLRGELTEL